MSQRDDEDVFAELVRRRSLHLLDQELERRSTLVPPATPEVRVTIPRFPPPPRVVHVPDQLISERPLPTTTRNESPGLWRALQLALSRILYRAADFTARS